MSVEAAIAAVELARCQLRDVEGTRALRDDLRGVSEELEGLRDQLEQFPHRRVASGDRYRLTAAGEAWLAARARCQESA